MILLVKQIPHVDLFININLLLIPQMEILLNKYYLIFIYHLRILKLPGIY